MAAFLLTPGQAWRTRAKCRTDRKTNERQEECGGQAGWQGGAGHRRGERHRRGLRRAAGRGRRQRWSSPTCRTTRARTLVGAIRNAGGKARYLHHDVTSEDAWIGVVADVEKTEGRLDILVNNAGIGLGGPSITMMSLEDFRRQQAVNVEGVFLGIKHGLPLMRKAGNGGSIINMSSVAGLKGSPILAGLLRHQGRGAALHQGDRHGVRRRQGRHAGELGAPRHHRDADLAGDRRHGPAAAPTRRPTSTRCRQWRCRWASRACPGHRQRRPLARLRRKSRYVTGAELVIDGGLSVR